MDQDRFDDLARLLGARGTRRSMMRATLAGLFGLGAAGWNKDGPEARAGRKGRRGESSGARASRRKTCNPDCGSGFDCVKQGRKRRCVCSTGVTCAGACCPTGHVCRNGACVVPATCIAPGDPCKGVGVRCCEGRICASGQGGQADVACYAPKTAACETTADCVYGTMCIDGRCGLAAPVGLGEACNPANQAACLTPGAACVPYDGSGAPAGTHCALPLGQTCAAAADCASYACGYSAGASAASTRRACAGGDGHACEGDGDCLLGTTCVAGTCRAEAVCDVCKGGGCAYVSIAEAYAAKPAGSSITIAPGTYDEPPIKGVDGPPYDAGSKSMTFRRCGPSGTVLWRRAPSGPDRPMVWFRANGDSVAMTFIGIDFDARGNGISKGAFQAWGGSVASDSARLTLMDCRFDSQTTPPVRISDHSDVEAFDCAFTNGTIAPTNEPGGIYAFGSSSETMPSATVRTVRCLFTGNSVSRVGGGIIAERAAVTLVDTVISGNVVRDTSSQQAGGAGIWLNQYGTLAFEGTTRVTGNVDPSTPPSGGSGVQVGAGEKGFGVAPVYWPVPPRLTGVNGANVTGNSPASTNCSISIPFPDGGGFLWGDVPVSCDAWCVASGVDVGYAEGCAPLCCSGTCSSGTTCR